jgi:hypothetical protein
LAQPLDQPKDLLVQDCLDDRADLLVGNASVPIMTKVSGTPVTPQSIATRPSISAPVRV